MSLDRDLVYATTGSVNLTVTPGTPTTTGPTNPFGVPDPPDEGSANGVLTIPGSNVTVVPIRDVLVTFSKVITAGHTRVDVTRSTQTTATGVVGARGFIRYRPTPCSQAPFRGRCLRRIARRLGPGCDPVLEQRHRADHPARQCHQPLRPCGGSRPSTDGHDPNDFHTDFNDDGHADFLWQRQTTGALSLWFMQGTTALSTNSFNPNGVADPHWKVIGSADFDRDGYPDLLWWHDQLGTFGVWFMKGTTLRERAMLNPSGFADTSWKVVALADFDGDGYPDLLWRHDVTGAFGVWLMQGTDLKARVMLNPTGIADTSWKIFGVGDFDGDGHPDLVWRNELPVKRACGS